MTQPQKVDPDNKTNDQHLRRNLEVYMSRCLEFRRGIGRLENYGRPIFGLLAFIKAPIPVVFESWRERSGNTKIDK